MGVHQNSTPSSGLQVLLPLRTPCTAEPGVGSGCADLAFLYYFQKDRKTVCSRLKDSAVKSDAKIARGLGRDGLQIARVLFFVGRPYYLKGWPN